MALQPATTWVSLFLVLGRCARNWVALGACRGSIGRCCWPDAGLQWERVALVVQDKVAYKVWIFGHPISLLGKVAVDGVVVWFWGLKEKRSWLVCA